MKGLKLKVAVCLVWTVSVLMFASTQNFWSANGQIVEKKVKSNPKPEMSQIDAFDFFIQKRFLIEPNFGMRRVAGPPNPTSPHLNSFQPKYSEEYKYVSGFQKEGWKMGIYLFGRVANPKVVKGVEQKTFSINYRLNPPLAGTTNVKSGKLPKTKNLLKEVKSAFIAFQTPNSENENNYEFSIGKWSYVARPVRAVNESCLKCHTDYVITEKLGDGKFTFRKRKVGDANGVIVYGFSKDN
jgi:hypothetical protein